MKVVLVNQRLSRHHATFSKNDVVWHISYDLHNEASKYVKSAAERWFFSQAATHFVKYIL